MIKTASFGIVHVSVAFGVVYVLTGSVVIGGAVALIEPLANTVAYHYHEKVWDRIRRRPATVTGGGGHVLQG
ncbi:putative membrane protein [Thioalkalivibrio nitratireducens DSM 14787]|uniref:Membrane protein n=1 Tax=Thioalkalivibrio nitratireducens (strain DSM 14787 / UNIQEM 213 / ALEN2) TaxID=1255043 RepID=L0E2D1_THIND|nr:DUF2061 domain-containing protein [Thioalkalivibrio nitratireducens]AGA35392.1 putative membrane protein [Thioalkalivibrio nitratireducens DSM 14787]